MLDDDHRSTGIHEAVQHADEPLYVGHVQPDGGLIEDVESPFFRSHSRPGSGRRELGDQLDALGLAAGEGRALLTQGEVPKPHLCQQRQGVVYGPVGGEEPHGLVHAHGQHITDAPVPVAHR
jgi:hypothetical protein